MPAPRTASVTHEIAIGPFFGIAPWVTSCIYFALVLLFVLNRSKILDVLGRLLTPLIIIILILIIGIGSFASIDVIMQPGAYKIPLISGLIEGYQTFDAIGGVVVGGVIIISLNLKGHHSFKEKKQLISNAGLLAGLGLFAIYAGLIYTGALYGDQFSPDITRVELLKGLSIKTLGNIGTVFLSVLVSLACFTTAVGIITGTADYFKGLLKGSHTVYVITAIIASILGVVMGTFDVHYIIDIALPALMFIYPVTIVLILLNVLPDRFTRIFVFRAVIISTLIFSIPDFLSSLGYGSKVEPIKELLPLGDYNLAWLLPGLVIFIFLNIPGFKKA